MLNFDQRRKGQWYMTLDQRKRDVLRTIVEDYIETAEPVASKTLVDKYHLPVSSATIRNTMAELEQLGYLEQPHTSAGRVPSDLGYRKYVEELMPILPIQEANRLAIRHNLSTHADEMKELLKQVSWILSEGTGYTSLAVSPRLAASSLKQLKMLMIEPGKVLVVIVLSAGLVKDKIVRLPDILNPQQLSDLSLAIEQRLDGVRLQDITLVTVQSSMQNSDLPESLLNQVAYEAYSAIKQADNLETYIDGMPKLFSHPEFRDTERAGAVLHALRDDGLIIGMMEETDPTVIDREVEAVSGSLSVNEPTRFMIRIGQELQQEEFKDCSFVAATCRLPGQISGSIGVIGPRRMAYSKVISQIGFIRQAISELNEFEI